MRESGVEPNSVSWNGLIAGFNHNGYATKSVAALQKMHLQGIKPDGSSISSSLPAVGDLEDQVLGMQIHGYIVKQGYGGDACVDSALVDMYGKCGCTREMLRVFEEMDQMEVGSCNALITGLSRNGLVDDAFRIFREFKNQGIELNVVSWTSMVACCVQNGMDMEALELFREMQLVGVEPNSVTIPCLLPACANIAALMQGKAIHCFSLRHGIIGDVSMWVVLWLTCGYAMHGRAKEAIDLFLLMQRSGQKPDFISFTCVLAACSQTGLTEEGCRTGRLEEAYAMIKEMPSEPDACVWGALLSSCRVHGNVSLGEVAAEKLFKLEPVSSGNYVLLSNIYASKGMWDGVDRVRDMMKGMGLRKNPGCSWIEIKNEVHVLLAGDKSHPQMTQIIERLETLRMEMKRSGYLPNTNLVLQDVEEQEKVHILCGHSEKLAIGFGLLNTPNGASLRVIKNLRICNDCHVVIKFISRFEGREIVVRDTNRFHHFKDGECSCQDYW
ncbi:pentatricopeptide repeat-containing protein [Cinnamomum micranthum f. kanehirae]|uniref:Pentatricopeptide repeat-containing protein n=1 Tax=Cinnamomum micranthum f. kanehirae TaxID=337451 RepID=A0A443PCG8_9MAGN|nr:pentatricopeptide repeat-containing protein [Cinnamomum micranthum f. kanehirae]